MGSQCTLIMYHESVSWQNDESTVRVDLEWSWLWLSHMKFWLVQLVWHSCEVGGNTGTYLNELTSMTILIFTLDQRIQKIWAQVPGNGEHRGQGGHMVISITALDWFSSSLQRVYGQKWNPIIACFRRAMYLWFAALTTTVHLPFCSTSSTRARFLLILHTTWHIVIIAEGRQRRERGKRR